MPQDLAAVAKAIIDANRYMTLATADEQGRPWASPVFFASHEDREFLWISSPEATHSRNIASRPEVGIVVFDSTVAPGTGQAVYMTATAEELAGAEIERGLEDYPGPAERGGRTVASDDVRAPAPYRLYRATVSQHSMLCPREPGRPCDEHGHAFDHRIEVAL